MSQLFSPMATAQMQTFLWKFNELYSQGLAANHSFEFDGGKLCVNLRAQLDDTSRTYQVRKSKPSRIRRRKRREEERRRKEEENRKEEQNSTVLSNKINKIGDSEPDAEQTLFTEPSCESQYVTSLCDGFSTNIKEAFTGDLIDLAEPSNAQPGQHIVANEHEQPSLPQSIPTGRSYAPAPSHAVELMMYNMVNHLYDRI